MTSSDRCNPNVPLGIQAGELQGFSVKMSSLIQFTSHVPRALVYQPPELPGQQLVPGTFTCHPYQTDVPELGVTHIESMSGAVDPLVVSYHIATRSNYLRPLYDGEK